MKHPVFCDFAFLEGFINYLKGKDLIEYLNSGDDYGIDLYRLLFKSSNIEIDKTPEEIIQLSKINPYINILLKSQSIKTTKVYETLDNATFLVDEIHPNAIFLIGKPKWEVIKLEEKYGLFFVSKDEMIKSKRLFRLQNESFSDRKKIKDFEFFKQNQHPCNALILTDDYFFICGTRGNKIYDSNAVEINLKPILKRLLPEKLAIDFHFTIILSPNDVSLDFNKVRSDIKLITDKYNYKILINFIQYNFHERHIFTNYYKITADKGFRNLVKNSKNDGIRWEHPKNSFEFRSLFYSISKDNDYLEKIEECKSLHNDYQEIGDDFTNRLLQ